jgi:Caspase domain
VTSASVIFLVLVLLTGNFHEAFAGEDANGDSAPINVPSYALVIGNREYLKPAPFSPKADNDAKVIANLLASLGFDVVVRINISHRELKEEIEDLRKRARIGRKYGVKPLVLFYFSGHGFIDDGGRQYMVGVDAGREGEDISRDSVTVEDTIESLSQEGIAVGLIDACRSDLDNYLNKATPAVRPIGAPVKIAAPDADYLVGYANQRGEPVLGYINIDDNHSPYAEGLIQKLGRDRSLEYELELVHNYIVKLHINHDPRVDPHMTGYVYAGYSPGAEKKIEEEWIAIKKTPTKDSVLEFIYKYRNGPFAPAATYWMQSNGLEDNVP